MSSDERGLQYGRGPVDPETVLAELSDVLDRAGFDAAIRYALAVVLLANEVRATTTAPFPAHLQQLLSDTLQELRDLQAPH